MTTYTNVPTKIIDDERLSAPALAILIWLIRQTNTEGITIKKIKESRADTGLAMTRRAVTQLEELGYLRRVQVHKDGRYQTGEYVITID